MQSGLNDKSYQCNFDLLIVRKGVYNASKILFLLNNCCIDLFKEYSGTGFSESLYRPYIYLKFPIIRSCF